MVLNILGLHVHIKREERTAPPYTTPALGGGFSRDAYRIRDHSIDRSTLMTIHDPVYGFPVIRFFITFSGLHMVQGVGFTLRTLGVRHGVAPLSESSNDTPLEGLKIAGIKRGARSLAEHTPFSLIHYAC